MLNISFALSFAIIGRSTFRVHSYILTPGNEANELLKMLSAWKEQADKLSANKISREEYDRWRYYYPKFDTTQVWAKVPSQELSDAMVKAFKDRLKDN